MSFAGAAVANRDDVLAAADVLRACQLQHQRLVERGDRGELEAVEAFDRGVVRNFVFEPVVNERSSCVSNGLTTL
jgi:hypothetical protein